MGAGDQVTLQALPALKVLLHTAKHPHAAVCGILLGPKENAARIDDAVPLFHHTTMNPLMETAFLLVEQYAKQTGKRLAGVYYAPAEATPASDDAQPAPPQLLAAAEQVRSHYPGAVLVTVDNCVLGDKQAVPFHAHVQDGGAWSRSSSLTVEEEGLTAFTRALGGVGGGGGGGKAGSGLDACRSLVDVDEHLDDAGKDFRNPQVQQLL